MSSAVADACRRLWAAGKSLDSISHTVGLSIVDVWDVVQRNDPSDFN